jgi:hypothetical protein
MKSNLKQSELRDASMNNKLLSSKMVVFSLLTLVVTFQTTKPMKRAENLTTQNDEK